MRCIISSVVRSIVHLRHVLTAGESLHSAHTAGCTVAGAAAAAEGASLMDAAGVGGLTTNLSGELLLEPGAWLGPSPSALLGGGETAPDMHWPTTEHAQRHDFEARKSRTVKGDRAKQRKNERT
jgi:hypothetical protein